MILLSSSLTIISVLCSFLRRRFHILGGILSIAVMILFLIDGVLFKLNSSMVLRQLNHAPIVFLCFSEAFLAWFRERDLIRSKSIFPSYTLPLLTLLTFSLLDSLYADNRLLYFFTLAIVFQMLWSSENLSYLYVTKRIAVTLVIFLLTTMALLAYDGELNEIIYFFLFWFTLNIIPLGLDKDSVRDKTYPFANRVLVLVMFFTSANLSYPFEYLASASIFLGSLSVAFLLVSKERLGSWLVYKRSIEALIIILDIVINGKITLLGIYAFLAVGLMSYIPRYLNRLGFPRGINNILLVFGFLFNAGVLFGAPTELVRYSFLKSPLDSVGLSILLCIAPIWVLNLFFWAKEFNFAPQSESKIDHLGAIIVLSAIMINTLLTL